MVATPAAEPAGGGAAAEEHEAVVGDGGRGEVVAHRGHLAARSREDRRPVAGQQVDDLVGAVAKCFTPEPLAHVFEHNHDGDKSNGH